MEPHCNEHLWPTEMCSLYIVPQIFWQLFDLHVMYMQVDLGKVDCRKLDQQSCQITSGILHYNEVPSTVVYKKKSDYRYSATIL